MEQPVRQRVLPGTGVNGTLSRLAGSHSIKGGGGYRILGVRSSTFGASTGSYSFDGRFTGNALADLLLGYPSSGDIPISADLDGYIHYTAGFAQDDWRVNNRLTVNYGLRVEHETNLQERNNRITTDFAMDTVSPLNDVVNLADPITGAPRTIYGGLLYAGQNGAPLQQGGTRGVQFSPRAGAVFKFSDETVLRGGWGIYVAPWNYSSAGTTGWAQVRLLGDDRHPAVVGRRAHHVAERPVPERPRTAVGLGARPADQRRRQHERRPAGQGHAESAAVPRWTCSTNSGTASCSASATRV